MYKPKEVLNRLVHRFNDNTMLKLIKGYIQVAGIQVVYAALLLYYAYHAKDTPAWAKRIVLGALAYLLAPLDLVPDLSPILGFTDDLSILLFGLVSIAGHVDAEARTQARSRMQGWFGQVDESDLAEVDKKL